jgi:hypothetical protein
VQLGIKFDTKPANLTALLNGARPRLMKRIEQGLEVVGAASVSTIRRDFRRGGTTPTRTAVRSGRLFNSYGHEVKPDGASKFRLGIGAIKPSDGGKVPIHARVHEGYDAQGNRVAQFIIRAKSGKLLTFPIFSGGGQARANITGWVSTKQVILKPRPSLDTIAKTAPAAVQKEVISAWRQILTGQGAA